MGFRFGSWPQFNGKKVVLEDDDRLNAAVPTIVPSAGTWKVSGNFQAVAAVSIRLDGTVTLDGTLVML
jgi:hypothetical protein